jgi:aconitate hydratase
VYRNSGPLDAAIEEEIVEHDIIAASVLSGNRNFEARVHQNIKANFLMSPPLVVAFALAGTVIKDVYLHPIGQDHEGNDVFLKDIWASLDEVKEVLQTAFDPETYKRLYSEFAEKNPLWNADRIEYRPNIRMGYELDVYPGASVLRRFFDGNREFFRL